MKVGFLFSYVGFSREKAGSKPAVVYCVGRQLAII